MKKILIIGLTLALMAGMLMSCQTTHQPLPGRSGLADPIPGKAAQAFSTFTFKGDAQPIQDSITTWWIYQDGIRLGSGSIEYGRWQSGWLNTTLHTYRMVEGTILRYTPTTGKLDFFGYSNLFYPYLDPTTDHFNTADYSIRMTEEMIEFSDRNNGSTFSAIGHWASLTTFRIDDSQTSWNHGPGQFEWSPGKGLTFFGPNYQLSYVQIGQ